MINAELDGMLVDNYGRVDCEENPFGFGTHLNFTGPVVAKFIDEVLNTIVGGNPVAAGALGLNNVLDVLIDMLKQNLPFDLVHRALGIWAVETVMELDDTGNTGNYFSLKNLTISGLDSIHVFSIDVIDDNTCAGRLLLSWRSGLAISP